MANNVSHFHSHLLIFFLLLILASHHAIQGASKTSRTSFIAPSTKPHSQGGGGGGGKRWVDKNPRRLGMNPNSNPEKPHLSLPQNLNRGGKSRDVSQQFMSFMKNLRRLGLNERNPKNSGDVVQRSTDSRKSPRRWMIGSVAPTCTYNECKGCKYKCRAEQVPVEGNDPINSPYHYKCVCHR